MKQIISSSIGMFNKTLLEENTLRPYSKDFPPKPFKLHVLTTLLWYQSSQCTLLGQRMNISRLYSINDICHVVYGETIE